MKAIMVDSKYGSLNTDDINKVKEAYEHAGIIFEADDFKTDTMIVEACQDADVLLCIGNPPITRKVFEGCPKLKFVQRFGIGVNSVDLEAASEFGKYVLYMPGFCTEELATHAASMILSLIRNTAYYDRGIRRGEWPKGSYFPPKDISKLTLGLYGFGGSARPLYRIFHEGFGTKVITTDPYLNEDIKQEYDIEIVSFEELLQNSDIISIHAPLNPGTRHVFDAEAFKKMKKDSMIINIARGPIIDEKALIEALQNGNIRFAGLDVFETEPLEEGSPLRELDNVILSCHSAFYGEGSKEKQVSLAISLITDALLKKELPAAYVANRDILDRKTDMRIN